MGNCIGCCHCWCCLVVSTGKGTRWEPPCCFRIISMLLSLERLNQQVSSAKDLKSKLETISALLLDLKAELIAYMESKIQQKGDEEGTFKKELEESKKKTHTEIQLAAVASARKGLDEVRLNIEKATAEVSFG